MIFMYTTTYYVRDASFNVIKEVDQLMFYLYASTDMKEFGAINPKNATMWIGKATDFNNAKRI